MGSRSSPEYQPNFEFPSEGGFEEPGVVKRPPKPGEKGYLEPGFHLDEEGRIVNESGDIYDENYNLLVKQLPQELREEVERTKKNPLYKHMLDSESALVQIAKINLAHRKRAKK